MESEIVRYNQDLKKVWDDFVESSKNGTFLFKRDYMDYHADRFEDHSLLFYRKGKLYCLLPANRHKDILYSHQGLTYGGLIMSAKCTAEGILEVFDNLIAYLKDSGIKKLIYKPIPHIYHTIPAEEDLYALFRHNASLTVRNISSTIDLQRPLKIKGNRREGVKLARKFDLIVTRPENIDTFWKILNQNLTNKYGTKPVHSSEEMTVLHKAFPQNIKLYCAESDGKTLGGILIYITENVLHTQYISASEEGKKFGAIDLIIFHLLEEVIPNEYPEIKYFDFGNSNEDQGRYLNESLIFQKEGFGGRGICYDTYEINLSD